MKKKTTGWQALHSATFFHTNPLLFFSFTFTILQAFSLYKACMLGSGQVCEGS